MILVTLLLSLLTGAHTPQTVDRSYLYSLNKNTKEFRIVGALINDETCAGLAAILNEKAVKQGSAVAFYCGPGPTGA